MAISDLSRIPGIGPKREKILRAAGINTLRDLIYYLPRKYIDRTKTTAICDLKAGEDAYFAAHVSYVENVKMRLIVHVDDGSGTLDLVFFNGIQFLQHKFKTGQRLLLAGVPTFFRDLQIVHPEFEILREDQDIPKVILPRYPLSEEMSAAHVEHKFLQKAALEALDKFSFTDAWPASLLQTRNFLCEADLLKNLHQPQVWDDLPALQNQLKWREALPLSLRLEGRRLKRQTVGRAWPVSVMLRPKLMDILPFALTQGQIEVTQQIITAMNAPQQFCGLLQGDVGAGKTVVGLLVALSILEYGGQVALMAPTEILALQHHASLLPWLTVLNISCALLTSDTPKVLRDQTCEELKNGQLQFIIGTHALYSADVKYHNLGLALIDEQHRFGVQQREALLAKGNYPHVLYMSATPIPRSLAQTVYGDLENFILKDKPKGRLPVKTRIVPTHKRQDMLKFLREEVQNQNQVFWVVPQISTKDLLPEEKPWHILPGAENAREDFLSVEKILTELKGFSKSWKVDCVHGKLPMQEKERVLRDFRKASTQVLVATTVIEVGVDVPEANLMIIENPDRFGLAQLHQLRGRTGRGKKQAWCFLALPANDYPPETFERLRLFSETDDGFKIAELDLQMRGAGNFEGTVQSGFRELRFLDWMVDFPLIQEARKLAHGILIGEFPLSPEERTKLVPTVI